MGRETALLFLLHGIKIIYNKQLEKVLTNHLGDGHVKRCNGHD